MRRGRSRSAAGRRSCDCRNVLTFGPARIVAARTVNSPQQERLPVAMTMCHRLLRKNAPEAGGGARYDSGECSMLDRRFQRYIRIHHRAPRRCTLAHRLKEETSFDIGFSDDRFWPRKLVPSHPRLPRFCRPRLSFRATQPVDPPFLSPPEKNQSQRCARARPRPFFCAGAEGGRVR